MWITSLKAGQLGKIYSGFGDWSLNEQCLDLSDKSADVGP